MKEHEEYARLRDIFADVDEKQLALVDGLLHEAARLRAQLDDLQEIAAKTGLVKIHQTDSTRQKELPVSRMLVRLRAGYKDIIAKLSSILGRNAGEDDDGLEEFE